MSIRIPLSERFYCIHLSNLLGHNFTQIDEIIGLPTHDKVYVLVYLQVYDIEAKATKFNNS